MQVKWETVEASPVDDDLLELLLHRNKVLELRLNKHPLYRHLCSYIQAPSGGLLQKRLFARLLQCSEEEVDKKLCLHDKSERVKAFAEQLYQGGFSVEAGSLLLTSLGFHRELLTVTDSLAFVKNLFSS